MTPAASFTKVGSRIFWAVWKEGFAVPLPKKPKTPPTETGWSHDQSKAYKAVFRRYGITIHALPPMFARAVHLEEIAPRTTKKKTKRKPKKKSEKKRARRPA
jgi:hypothetical protein